MRRRRGRRWLLPIILWASHLGRDGPAQTVPLPPALDDRELPLSRGDRAAAPGSEGHPSSRPPPAPQPIPGPAGMRLPRGRDGSRSAAGPADQPRDRACNSPGCGRSTSPRRRCRSSRRSPCSSRPRPSGSRTSTRASTTSGTTASSRTSSPGPNFRKGRQTFFVGGGPSLFVGLTDAIFAPLAARRVVAARRADLQTARNDVLFTVSQAFFELQAARGRLLGVGASIARAEMLVNFATALAPSLIAPLEINRAKAELQSLRQTQQVAIRDWRVASARLAEVLLLDPATLLEPIEPPFLQVTLVAAEQSAEELVPIALQQSPRDRLAARAGRRGRAALAAGEEAPVPAQPDRPQPDDDDRVARGGQPLRRRERVAGFQRIPASTSRSPRSGSCRMEGSATSAGSASGGPSRTWRRSSSRGPSSGSSPRSRRPSPGCRPPGSAWSETDEGVRQAIESADKNFIGLRETARPAGELLRLIVRPQEVVAAIDRAEHRLRAVRRRRQ